MGLQIFGPLCTCTANVLHQKQTTTVYTKALNYSFLLYL